MSMFLEHDGGRISYDVAGEGPLVVLAPGIGDLRSAYRFVAPKLVEAGYRVATMDLRGHGESSVGWKSHSRTDTAGDITALIRELGGPAIVAGASFAGGAAAIVAAEHPELVRAIVQIGPGTRVTKPSPRDLNRRYVKGMSLIAASLVLRNVGLWGRYLDYAFPGARPADFENNLRLLQANLREPGRMAAAKAMGLSSAADAGAALPRIQCTALVLMGTLDPDFADPAAEAEGIVGDMPSGLGRVTMLEGAGHYPHAQFPDAVTAAMLPFLKEVTTRA